MSLNTLYFCFQISSLVPGILILTGINMNRKTVNILLWCFILLVSGIEVKARHNITAALVALAPGPEDDGTALTLDDSTSKNTSSSMSVNWFLFAAVSTTHVCFFLNW